MDVSETGEVTGECPPVALRLLLDVGESLPAVGECAFVDDGLAGMDLLEVNGLFEANSAGSSTICESPIMLGEAEDGSGDMMIDGAIRFTSWSSIIGSALRSGDDERPRTIDSG